MHLSDESLAIFVDEHAVEVEVKNNRQYDDWSVLFYDAAVPMSDYNSWVPIRQAFYTSKQIIVDVTIVI